MLIKKNIDGDTYIKLMKYIFQNCDMISLRQYHNQHQEETKKKIKYIISTSGYSEKDIVQKYSNTFLEEMYQRYKDDAYLFGKEYQRKYENKINQQDSKRIYYFLRRISIESNIKWLFYHNITTKWIDNIKTNIISKREIILEDELENKEIHHSTIYYIKLTEKIEDEILKKKSIYDWCFPNSLEDITFYKNDYCFLYSVGHEELCDIYCESEEEYAYLKSIGIAFLKDKFILEPKENLHYTRFQ